MRQMNANALAWDPIFFLHFFKINLFFQSGYSLWTVVCAHGLCVRTNILRSHKRYACHFSFLLSFHLLFSQKGLPMILNFCKI